MEDQVLNDLLLKTRRIYIKLSEFEDLTKQLAEAVTRRDEVSVQMLLNMRGEPANQMTEIDQQLRSSLLQLPVEDAIRAREILEGGEKQRPEEEMLCNQVKQNQRLIQRCKEMDRRISLSMDSKHSFYTKFREAKH